MTHTKGPWYVIKHPTGWTIQNKRVGAGDCIARQYADSSVANALLIASAPELREELIKAHRIIENALNLMTIEQKAEWGRMNERDGVDGEGVTRANEREVAIQKAEKGEGR